MATANSGGNVGIQRFNPRYRLTMVTGRAELPTHLCDLAHLRRQNSLVFQLESGLCTEMSDLLGWLTKVLCLQDGKASTNASHPFLSLFSLLLYIYVACA